MKDAALRLLEEDAEFQADVQEPAEQADQGELVDDEVERLWLGERERS